MEMQPSVLLQVGDQPLGRNLRYKLVVLDGVRPAIVAQGEGECLG